jgi:hypothetical protein
MKAEIKAIGEIANQVEVKLYREVVDLDNFATECDCDDCVTYNFSNTQPHSEFHVVCLNCGGHVLPKKDI